MGLLVFGFAEEAEKLEAETQARIVSANAAKGKSTTMPFAA